MATKSPAPVDTGATASGPVGPLDYGPEGVPPGPASGVPAKTPTYTPPVTKQSVYDPNTDPLIPQAANISTTVETPVATPNTVAPTTPRYVQVQQNGNIIVNTASAFNFTGNGVTVTQGSASGVALVNITAGSGGNGNVDWNNVSNSILPSSTNTYDLGSGSNRWASLYTVDVGATGAISASGNITGAYIYGNGAYLTGISGGNASTGNIGFVDDTIYDINGLTVNNADLSHGATSALLIPSNGNSTTPTQLYNSYGNITLTTGPSPGDLKTWIFDSTGALNLTGNGVVRRQDSLNLVSNGFVQLQWVDSGNLNIPDPNGSTGPLNWAYIHQNGFTVETGINYGLGNTGYGWNFGTDGVFTAPGNITTTGNAQAAAVKTNLINNTGSNQRVTIDPDNTNLGYIQVYGFDDGGERVTISNQYTNSAGIYFYTEGGNTFRMYQGQMSFPDATWQNTAYPGTATSLTLTGNISAGNISSHDGTFTGNINTTLDGSFGGNLDVDGNTHIGGNLFVVGNINFSGNVTSITGNSGAFYGNAAGVGALYAGIPVGYANVVTAVIQATADLNDYTQINAQNLNHGNTASMEYVITGDLGNDTTDYIDIGFSSSSWDGTQTNSLGTAVAARDGYLYVQGGGGGGNLVIGTTTAGRSIKFNVGGPNSANTVGEIFATGISMVGNVRGGNILTTGILSATGNITGNYILGNGSQLTGLPATYGNANVAANLAAFGSNPILTTGNITGGNVSATGNIITAGQIQSTAFTGGNISWTANNQTNFQGTIQVGQNTIKSGGGASSIILNNNGANIGVLGVTSTANSTSNITGALIVSGGAGISSNVYAGGLVVATGNVSGGNVTTIGQVSATGNITGNYFVGNGSLLTGISAGGGTSITNGTSNVVVAASGNVTAAVTGSTIATWAATGEYITGVVSATGNITGGNLSGTSIVGTLTTAAQTNITSVGTLGSLNVTANVAGGNLTTVGQVSATGNITSAGNVAGTYFIGNGSQLTGITASGGTSIINGTSNVAVAASANVTTAVTGNVISTVAATGQYVAGVVSATGNITGNYFVGNGSLLTGITSAGTSISNGTSNVSVLSSANVTVGVAGTGNVAVFATNGAFVTGNVSATGNVLAGNLLGTVATAAQTSITSLGTLTSLTVSGTATFSGTTTAISIGTSQTTGTTTIGNATGTGNITIGQSTATQNINVGFGAIGTGNTRTINIGTTAGNGTTAIAIGPATGNSSISIGAFAPVTIANTGNAALSVVGNITGGNIITAGSTGNITGANVISATTLSATGNINGGNVNGGILSATGNVVVSGSGGISIPNNPAFRVYGNSSAQIVANTTITATQGATVDYNQGSFYNNTTGLFTAPVAGLYSCWATLRVGNNNSLNQASIQKNSSNSGANVIAFWETDTSTGTATHFTMSGCAKLAVNDTIRLQVITGNVNFDANDSWGVTFLG